MRLLRASVLVLLVGCGGSSSSSDAGPIVSTGAGHFTYGFEDKVFRIDARAGATPARFGALELHSRHDETSAAVALLAARLWMATTLSADARYDTKLRTRSPA